MIFNWLFKDNNGDENDHFHVVDIINAEVKDLTPFENVKVELVDELEDNENEVLIMMNKRNSELFDVQIKNGYRRNYFDRGKSGKYYRMDN